MTRFIKQQITSSMNQFSTANFRFPDIKYMFLFSPLWSSKNKNSKVYLVYTSHLMRELCTNQVQASVVISLAKRVIIMFAFPRINWIEMD